MDKKRNIVAEKIASRHLTAERIVNSYLVLKVPVGYSFIHNAKAIIKNKLNCDVQDEDLESIIARFLDLVIFGLTKDVQSAGDAMPSADQFFEICNEVLDQNRFDDDEEGRFDEMDDGEDFDGDEDEAAEKGRF